MNPPSSHLGLFSWFVAQQHQLGMVHLGKLIHPLTGEVERDLAAAQLVVDLLAMLEEKCAGNLSPEESRLLAHSLTTLRMNYVEEVARGDSGQTDRESSRRTGVDSKSEGPRKPEEPPKPDETQRSEGTAEDAKRTPEGESPSRPEAQGDGE